MAKDNIRVGLELDDKGFKRSLQTATQSVNKFGDAAKSSTQTAVTGFQNLSFSIKQLVAASGILLLIDQFVKLGKFAIQTTSEVERLRVQLDTVTGSAEVTAEAFNFLQTFAAKTPYSINDLTEAFTKLASYGIAPTERAMEAFGNVASGMNKPLEQMVEAVAAASMGQFQNLKSFGIKAENQGNQIAFNFKGMTTVIKNDSQSIVEYLTKLGEVEFAGGMEKQSRTFSGLMSTLGDAFAQSMQKITTESKAFDGLKDLISELIVIIPPLMDGLGRGVQFVSGFIKSIVNYVQIFVNSINTIAFSAAYAISEVGNMLGLVSDKTVKDLRTKMSNEIELLKGNIDDLADAGLMMSGAFKTVSESAIVGRDALDAYNASVTSKAVEDAERRKIERTKELAASMGGLTRSLELQLKQAREKLGGDISLFGASDREKAKVQAAIALQHQYEQQVLQITQRIATSKDEIEVGLLQKQKARIAELFEEQKRANEQLLDLQFDQIELKNAKDQFKSLVSVINPLQEQYNKLAEAQDTLFNALTKGLVTTQEFEHLWRQVGETFDPVVIQMKELGVATDNWLMSVDPAIAAGAKLADNIKFLDAALASGKVTQEEYNRLLREFNKESALAIPTYDEWGNKMYTMTTAAKDFSDAVEQMGQGLSKTLREGGSIADHFKNKLINAFDKIADSFIQNGINNLFGQMMGGMGGGGGFGGMLSGLFAGFFADGGKIPAGKFGVVGEKGPEVVTGPAQVYSNKDSFGGDGKGVSIGKVENNFSVNLEDFNSMFRQAAAENADYLMMVQQQLSNYRR